MDKVYQYSSLNMGWCVNCHLQGYDPKVGNELASMVADGKGGAVLPAARA